MTDPAETLFASIDGVAAYLSNKECVFTDRLSGRPHVMTTDVLQTMDLCRQFRTLQQHAATLEQQIPQLRGQQANLLRLLETMRQLGLLHSAEQMIERAGGQNEPEHPTKLAAIRTSDRPDELARLLASANAHEQRFGSRLEYLIVDDSRSSANQVANARSAREAGINARYLGREWRNKLLTRARESGVGEDSLASLLGAEADGGFSGGQVWNALLLATAGQTTFLFDDDFLLDFRRPPEDSSRLALAGDKSVDFVSGAEGFERFVGEEEDVLRRIGAVLGGSVAASASAGYALGPEMLREVSWVEANELLNGTQIKTVETGSWGDMRMDTTMWFYLLPSEQLAPWLVSRENYFAQLARPQIAHCGRSAVLRDLASFTPLAVDNQELLPPAAPLGRGEDLFFNMLVRFVYPRSVNLDLPTMVGHHRPDGAEAGQVTGVYRPWSSRLIADYALARMDRCEAEAPVVRMNHLVSTLRDLAEAPGARRTFVLRELQNRIRADLIAGIQQTIGDLSEVPAYFQVDANDWVQHNGQALTQADELRARDWPDELDADGCATQFQTDLLRYADLLNVWPTVWQWASEQDDLLAL